MMITLISDRERELMAQVDEMNADAKRYRWLRERSYIEVYCNSPRIDGWIPSQLDAAIDTAMAVQS